MQTELKNKKSIRLSLFTLADLDDLTEYLQQLSAETKSRFGPHAFDKQSISELYRSPEIYRGYIARDCANNKIMAYSIIKTGYLDHDRPRLESYGFIPDHTTDCTFAPSVADAWQGLGAGNSMLRFILSELQNKPVRRMILWGGVQAGNEKAVQFYLRNGFTILGQFSYHGENYDMALDLH